MLAQVILVMRAPFKGQRAIGAHEGTHSSVDTLVDLEIDRDTDEISCSFVRPFSPKRIVLYKITLLDISPGAERSV